MDGLVEEVKDLYSAEKQLLKALPKMEKNATSQKLKDAFSSHLKETEGQLERLEQIGELLGKKISGKTCKAMQGLIEEGSELMEEESDNKALLDALLIGAAQRVEHYEIAAYGTACAIAQELGENKIAKLLEATLEEEKKADKKLTSISEGEVLAEANMDWSDDDNGSMRAASNQKSQSNKRGGNGARAMSLIACLALTHQFGPVVFADNNEARNIQHETEATNYKSDNSGRNIRDRNTSRLTADDQKMGGTEQEVLARIRREIVANDTLSINAHNVKIMVEDGKVTLRGPVKSEAEKNWIQEAAARTAVGYSVSNQLEVTSQDLG